MWSLTLFGWLIVVVLCLAYAPSTGWLLLALAVPSLFLTFNAGFPNRERGLIFSWVGPILVVLTYKANAAIQGTVAASLSVENRYLILTPIALWDMCVVLIIAWLWRGYGAIPWLAMLSTVCPHRYRIEKAATEYPWRLWWLVTLGLLVLLAGKLGLLAWWLYGT